MSMAMTPTQRAAILINASIATDESADQSARSAALAELRAALDDVQAEQITKIYLIRYIMDDDAAISYVKDNADPREVFQSECEFRKTRDDRYKAIQLQCCAFGPWTTVEEFKP